MSDLLMMILGGVARTAVAGAGGWLAAKGYVDSDTFNTTVGAATTVGVGLWSIWQKTRVEKK